jgi:hypothetical protein
MRFRAVQTLNAAILLAGALAVALPGVATAAPEPGEPLRLAQKTDKAKESPTSKKASTAKPKADPKTAAKPQAPDVKRMRSMSQWDFVRLDPNKWQWRFAGGEAIKCDAGALYRVRNDRPGAVIERLKLDAEDVAAIRVDKHLQRMPADRKAHGSGFRGMRLYWAGPADVKAKPDWPYSPERSAPFVRSEDNQDVWVAVVAGNPQWKGTIERMMIVLDVPEEQLKSDREHFNVYTRKIELLK